MREEQAFTLVQLADGVHIFCGKGEIEHIKILHHTLLVRGFRDDYDTALDEETQCCLRHGQEHVCRKGTDGVAGKWTHIRSTHIYAETESRTYLSIVFFQIKITINLQKLSKNDYFCNAIAI